MKISKNYKFYIFIAIIICVSFWGIPLVLSNSTNLEPYDYSFFCNPNIDSKWNVVIYLDINACISCTEDISAWKELENKLPEYDAVLTLWAPREDSIDIAYAMELEGLKTPVNVIDKSMLVTLGWDNKTTPIKILLDKNCQLNKIISVMNDSKQSKIAIENLLSEISSEK